MRSIGVGPGLHPAINRSKQPTHNIFSPEQEMILGDLTYQRIVRDLRLVKDPELDSYITKIGERLVQRLPPTGLKFQFIIIDVPEANAFNVTFCCREN